MVLVHNGVVQHGVKVPAFTHGKMVDVESEVAHDRDLGSVPGIVAPAHATGSVGRAILVGMDKNIVLHPGVGPVEIEDVIAGAHKDVVDEMNDRARPIAAREIDHVVIADWTAKKVPGKNPMSATLNAAVAMDHLEPPRRVRKHTILDHEGSIIDMDVGSARISKSKMIEEHC